MPQTMVLTESDYIDFIVKMNRNSDIMPKFIRNALASTSILFLGYSINDINFRIIFRGISDFVGSRYLLSNVAVMLLPSKYTSLRQEKLQEYFNDYAKYMYKVNIYWGDVNDFSRELRKRFNSYKQKLT
ncbi:MAG: SIR2 family protein [Candidatus Nitrosocosmicus sp.]|nr:SIR2 family protein [Candidatus Nitrosocosmicus sp.]